MRAFIKEFRTTNKLLFKERNNSLSELRFEVHRLSKVIDNALISNSEVKGVTTRGGKTTTQDTVDSFPSGLRKGKEEAQQRKFLENLKQLHINLPFIEALSQMPKYAKFLKGLLTNKAMLEEACIVTMNKRCLAVLLNKLPLKEQDPGSFTIPCDIGHLHINNALADLGASISLMPYTMYEKLGLGEPKPTRMSLELADSDQSDSFLLKGMEKSIYQSDLKSCNSIGNESDDNSDIRMPIRRIDPVNTPYLEAQKIVGTDGVKSERLYSASSNEIDEKKPVLKDLPHHLEYAYLHVIGWRVCIDYRKLNDATRKDHFSLPFIDQMLERLSGNEYYYFLDGFSGFFQIPIAPEDQEKTTLTCPYGTFAYRRMAFGLCNALVTFQRCMAVIFHNMVEDFMEVFMDDFLVFGSSFNCHLDNLDKMLARCEKTNLVLNWEKCHFIVKEGIVLGHKISKAGIEVDRAKIDVIAKLPYPTNVKGVRSFLGHTGFYQRFIKDFSMISKPMTQLLMKDAKFDFSDDCKKAFNILKEKLTTMPIIISTDWNVPFALMYDASDFAVGAILGQRIDRKFKLIYYASKTLNDAQEHYTTTEKELLAVVFSFDKLCPYLILSKTVVYTDHSALKYLFSKQDVKPRIIRSLGVKDLRPDFGSIPIAGDRLCPDNVIRRCVVGREIFEILAHCHSGPTRGHHSTSITRRKVYKSGFFWPSIFKDAKDYTMKCDACQWSGNISSRSEMPQNNIQACDVFDIWGLYFMGPFPNSKGNRYILVVVDYVSKWVEAQELPTNDARVVVRFLRGLFSRFGVPKALISERGTQFSAAKNRFIELNELMDLRDGAYENTQIYKEKTKKWHDSRLRRDKDFKVRDKVNGQRLKKYYDGQIDTEDKEVIEFEEDTT
ncbi:reverse transcriptase domain-containing protein [Tanacetum coccineum]